MGVTALPLLPSPRRIEFRDGEVRISAATVVVAPGEESWAPLASTVAGEWDLRVARPDAGEAVVLVPDAGVQHPEGYVLDAVPGRIEVRAAGPEGAFRGVQTLFQLGRRFPALRIEDEPAFPWRGFLLDSCRHFMPKDLVLRLVDLVARFKINRFHWHLTEDQGWRLEVRAFPRLTEIGAWRTGEDGARHGGFYSREDVRAVVQHAAERHVTVVPEIEMPGHCGAALAAYPELSCTGGPFAVETRWGIFEDVFCAGQERTFEFLEAVLDEVVDLFPGRFVHVGGDEVPKTRWRACPRCQARLRAQGLGSEEELQGDFLRRVEAFLHARGRTAVGWDEILEGGLPPRCLVQSWRGLDGALQAVRAGHEAVSSPTTHCYLDYGVERIDLCQAYSFDPVPPEASAEEARRILGGEGNLWSERAPPERVEAQLFPRLLALAERLWSGTGGSYADFRARWRAQQPWLRARGVRWGPESVEDET